MTFLDMIEIYNARTGNELDYLGGLFSDIVLDERLDKDTMIGVLLDKCGAMHTIYETTATFKYYTNLFFKKYQWNITKMVDSINFQYEPLKNKYLEWTETTDITQNLDTDEDRERQNTGTQGSSYSESETNTISAMNSSNYEPDNKSDTSGSNTRTDNLNEKIDANKSEELTWDETDTHTESGLVNGTYQELIEKERKLAQFNVYNWIADKYAKELFLLVY